MRELPLSLALAAGTLAAINPCGFALLPAYLSFLVLGDTPTGRAAAVGRALLLTAAMTTGFAAVFAAFGLVLAPIAGAVQQHLPWFTVGFGLLLAAAGVWLAAGRSLPGPPMPARAPAVSGRSVGSMVAFGAAYGLASLGCTIGPFLAIVVASFRTGSTADGVALFLAYAGGMGLTVGAAAIAVALARVSLVRRVRRFGPTLSRLSGVLLVVVGGYVAYYGWYEVRAFRGGAQDPVVDAATRVQAALSDRVEWLGAGALAGIVLMLLVVAAAMGWRARRSG